MVDRLSERKEVVTLEKKLRGQTGGQDYIDGLRKLDLIGLENKLKDMAIYRQAVISTKGIDNQLIEARSRVNALTLPYTQDLTANAEKSRFIGLLLQEMEGFEPTMPGFEEEE